MDSDLEFKPCNNYLKLVEISENRKHDLGMQNLNYRQLGRRNLYQTHKYELHHIIPNYRLKSQPHKVRNALENIAILTTEEHLLAHLYLSKFEQGVFKHKANMALIQLFSFKQLDIETIKNEDQFETILKAVKESRSNYFGSPTHISGCSKSGKIAGQKRKERFANDPEFRKYILESMKLSPERKAEISENIKAKNKKLPPWLINSKVAEGKHKPQLWKYFDTIYTAVIKYGLSYKTIAKVIDEDYARISNIVRIIKSNQKENIDFSENPLSKLFYETYEPTLHNYEKYLYYYSNLCDVPWNKNIKTESWENFDKYYEKYVIARKLGYAVSDSAYLKYNVTSLAPLITKEADRLYTLNILEFHKIPWYPQWEMMRKFSRKQSRAVVNSMRLGIFKRNNKYFVSKYNADSKKAYTISFHDLASAQKERDEYEHLTYGKLRDIRHLV